MKPVSQLITSLSDDEEDMDEESRWPKLRRLSTDKQQMSYDDDEEEYEQDENTEYKVNFNYLFFLIPVSNTHVKK